MTDALTLSSAAVQVTLVPDFGARITSLTDLRSGRDWVVPGPLIGGQSDDATFGGAESRGWDECFPTVAPCESAEWKRRLRDHGDIWGRPTQCTQVADGIKSTFSGDGFHFQRRLMLQDDVLHITYVCENNGADRFPYMWSQHCLLATSSDDTLFVTGAQAMDVTAVLGQRTPPQRQFIWPAFDDQRSDLTRIEDVEAGWAMKAYAPVGGKVAAGVQGPNGGIEFEWHGDEIPFLGLWLDYGGWPAGASQHQIAIEPTTAPTDDLVSAQTTGHERWLNPSESHTWTLSIRLTQSKNTETKS